MTEGADGTSESAAPPPTAAGFDEGFAIAAASRGLRRVWQLADPDLPVEIEPFSFVSAALLDHVAAALGLSPGQTLVDLGCGRGGPGLWLARQAGAFLVGVDFSAVAIEQASQRAALFEMLRMWVLTVFTETDSSLAISGLDRLVGRYRSTLSSVGLSSSFAAWGAGLWRSGRSRA